MVACRPAGGLQRNLVTGAAIVNTFIGLSILDAVDVADPCVRLVAAKMPPPIDLRTEHDDVDGSGIDDKEGCGYS